MHQFEQYLAVSREVGARQAEAIGHVNLGMTWYDLGDFPAARAASERSVAICREIGRRYPEGYGLACLAYLADEEDDPASALRLAEESLALRREIRITSYNVCYTKLLRVCPNAFTKPVEAGNVSRARRMTGNGMGAPP